MHWVLFFSIIALLQAGVDAYVLLHWMRWVRRRGWSRWLYRVAWGIGAGMFVLSLVFWIERRLGEPGLTGLTSILYAGLTLWYFPKLLLLPVLLLRDIGTAVCRWWRRRSPKSLPIPDVQRRRVLTAMGMGMMTLPFVAVSEGMARTTYRPRLFTVNIPIAGLPAELEGLRIVHLSDLHAGSFASDGIFWQTVEEVERIRPDVIVVTGDFVNFHPDELRIAEAALRRLSAPLGVYGCLGNHDHYMSSEQHRALRHRLERVGIDVLVNENRVLFHRGTRLQLAGTDNTGAGQRFADLERALTGLEPTGLTILLFHDPRFWEWEVEGKAPVTLGLCGHTHGGQIGLRFAGQEWSVAQLVYRYWAGIYRTGSQWLYVNRGLGFVGPAVRMGIPPEIALLVLQRA